SPETGASIENNERPIIEAHLHTGGIATVTQGGGPWCGDRPPCPPESNLHAVSPHTRTAWAYAQAAATRGRLLARPWLRIRNSSRLLAYKAMIELHSALDHARPGRGRSHDTKGRQPL